MKPQLTEDQEDFILLMLEKEGLQLDELQEDLADHLCFEVEREMENGNDFFEAYSIAKSTVLPERAVVLQDDIEYFFEQRNKKIRIAQIFVGTIMLTAFGAGLLNKFMEWYDPSSFFTTGALLFLFGFFPIVIFRMYLENSLKGSKSISLLRKQMASGFLVVECMTLGALLEYLDWPFSFIPLITGVLIFLISFVPLILPGINEKWERLMNGIQ